MICYNCGSNLYDIDSKTCNFCGVSFGPVCLSCKAPNPPMAKFCFNCGKSVHLQTSSGNVQNFSSLGEARKNVAVIFADVSGFTALSEKLDPEIVREIINDCFDYITKPVYELEGTIDKFIGDCVMILFGAQATHSDDAKRAVLCSMKMLSLAREFSDLRVKPLGFDLDLSIGVHYGLVVTGVVGNYFDKDYTVMGDTVNTAQRIQAHAPKSVIYVSETVYSETREDITYSNPISFFVKNKENEIKCYIPKIVNSKESTAKTSIPFIGRDKELSQLHDLYNEAMTRSSRAVLLTGAAGIGKSRLLTQFTAQTNENVKIVSYECTPASASKPYSLISGLLLNILSIQQGDAELSKQSRIISYFSFILEEVDDAEIKRAAQFLGLIIGLETDKEFQNILSAMGTKAIQEEIQRIVAHFFHAYGRKFQSFIILEDIHWGDIQSLSILKRIISTVQGSLFLLLTSRSIPESLGSQVNILTLKPFEINEIEKMTRAFINCGTIENEFIKKLDRVSGGNPLYLYELLVYLRKHSLYTIENNSATANWGNQEIPANLQGLILSNLNDINESTREMIQVATVIGKDFSTAILNQLLGRDSEVCGDIPSALESNLISFKERYAYHGHVEKKYTFNHETERETIYDSILNKQKKALHKKTGEIIEQLYEKKLENYYDVLGEHFEKAAENSKAADYYFEAACKLKLRFNYSEALNYYKKSLSLYLLMKQNKRNKLFTIYKESAELQNILAQNQEAIESANEAVKFTKDLEESALVMLLLAGIYKDQGKYEEALNALDSMEGQLKKTDSLYGSYLSTKCIILGIVGRQEEALKLVNEAEKILTKNKDYANLVKTYNAAGAVYFFMGSLDQALDYFSRSYKNAERIQDLQTLMKTASNLAVIYNSQGNIARATEFFTTAMELSKKLSHQQGYMSNCINFGILHIEKGYFNKAHELFDTALKLAKETNSPIQESISLTNLGDVFYHLGDLTQALNCYENALRISIEIDDVEGQAVNNLLLAKVSIAQLNFSEAAAYLHSSDEQLKTLENSDIRCDYYYYLSLCQSKHTSLQEALDNAKVSQRFADSDHVNKKVSRALRLQGTILQQINNWSDSLPLFSKSILIAEREGSDYEAAKSYYLRAISYKQLGQPQQAEQDYQTAQGKILKVDKCRWTSIIQNN